MKRIALTAFSTLAVLVLLFLYPTSTGKSGTTAAEAVSAARVVTSAEPSGTTVTTTGQGPDPTTAGSAGTGSATGSSNTAGATTSPSTSAAASSQPAITVDGASEMTRYGVVQVRVVIANGAITDVTALQYPQSEREDIKINSKAVPLLRAQVLAAQSAKIDGVSGATFTTDGYVTSLQSALDAAGFAG
jgi:uncharacterized protein with FMN-binding domain